MKQMWSPWRSQYIKSFAGAPKRKSRDSIFTRARKSRDDRKNLIVWRGKLCFVIMNRYPYNSGHLMIVPNRQTADFADLTAAETAEIMEAARRAMRALDALMKPGVQLRGEHRAVRRAGVDNHIHFHLVPRWSGDANFMPVLSDIKVISEDMASTWENLRKTL